jgi:hypothetical protein
MYLFLIPPTKEVSYKYFDAETNEQHNCFIKKGIASASMSSIIYQIVIPFILSAFVVILITMVAERYGTKVGGILGTLPSTIVIAFLFIAINENELFASQAAAVVPAELGINIIFLFIFSLLVHRSTILAFVGTFAAWSALSFLLVFFNMENIAISIIIYLVTLLFCFFILEKRKAIPSRGMVKIHYTPIKIMLRGVLAGIVIAIAVFLSDVGSIISGIFSVFPAILSSTMLISVREHGPDFAAGMAKSMMIGLSSVATYAVCIHVFYPWVGIGVGTLLSYILAFCVTMVIFMLRKRII